MYKAEIPASLGENIITDFNQNGVVDRIDMEVILTNYLNQDFLREDSKTPEENVDGKDIIDILESCGYFDETPEYNVVLKIDKESSLVGEEVNLLAVPPTDEVDFEYELAVREKGSKEWTLLQERTLKNKFKWVSEKSEEYEFKLRIFLDEIEYEVQDNKLHTVKEIVVSKIQNLDAVKLSWEAPKTTDGLVEYIVYKDGKEIAIVDSSNTECTVENLKSNTIYGFNVVDKYSSEELSK